MPTEFSESYMPAETSENVQSKEQQKAVTSGGGGGSRRKGTDKN